MNVLDEIDSYQIRTNTPEVPDALKKVLEVLGHGHDHVARADVDRDRGVCEVAVEWYIRGCHQGEDYEIPLSVLTADDVTHAARVWKADTEVAACQQRVREAETSLRWARESLKESEQKRAAIARFDGEPTTIDPAAVSAQITAMNEAGMREFEEDDHA